MKKLNKQIGDIIAGNCWMRQGDKVDFMVKQKWYRIKLLKFVGHGNWLDYAAYMKYIEDILADFRIVTRKFENWRERLDEDSLISDLHLLIQRGVRKG